MQTTEQYRAYILRLRDEQHRPPAELWPAAKRYLGEAEAFALLGPEPPAAARPVPPPRARQPAGAAVSPAPAEGVGTELKAVITELNLKKWANCNACNSLAAQMNAGGPGWVAANRATIIGRLREARKQLGWGETLAAAFGVGMTRMGWRLDLNDIEGSLLEEAIRRWEAKEAGRQPPPDTMPP